jgi:hypothetical protein
MRLATGARRAQPEADERDGVTVMLTVIRKS